MLELVSLHSTSMSIIGSMVYFGHPVLLRTYGIYDGFIYFQRQFRIRWKGVKSLEDSSSYRNHRRDFTRQVPTRVCDRGILLRILPSAKYYILYSR